MPHIEKPKKVGHIAASGHDCSCGAEMAGPEERMACDSPAVFSRPQHTTRRWHALLVVAEKNDGPAARPQLPTVKDRVSRQNHQDFSFFFPA
mmetsp:Transcript_18602/g.56150  ORF Transcript_18602/g.56150 Transcript_18602/m.56150 type:complete len:92 (-) Transcript_18602:1196-1471(-)